MAQNGIMRSVKFCEIRAVITKALVSAKWNYCIIITARNESSCSSHTDRCKSFLNPVVSSPYPA